MAPLTNPAMRGGPFIACGADRAGEVKALLERTQKEQADTLRFAQAIGEMEKLLAASPPAMSLEGLYQQVPDLLRGYVELVYDLNNRVLGDALHLLTIPALYVGRDRYDGNAPPPSSGPASSRSCGTWPRNRRLHWRTSTCAERS